MAEKKGKDAGAWSRCGTAASRRAVPVDGGTPGWKAGRGLEAQPAATGGGAATPGDASAALGNSVYAGSLCKLFFEESEPLRALDLALRFYMRSYLSGGRVKICVLGPDRVEIRFAADGVAKRPSCQSTLAYLRDAVHLATGAAVEAREERCVRRGDSHCAHQIHWASTGA